MSGAPLVMGVVNVTPDSFSDGGRYDTVEAAVAHGLVLLDDGADILDIGGESTRPGATRPLVTEELARVVDVYAKRPQVQERLTTQIADALVTGLEARGVIVVIEAEHLCMTMRGVRKAGARTITSAVRGQMHNAATRSEAMALITSHKG